MSLYSMVAPKGANGFGYGSTAEDVTAGLDLSGKTILVTGCNSGIGTETVRVLAMRGAHVLATARTVEKARAACAMFPGKTTGLACELSDPASVRACAAEVKKGGHRLDAIVCNAGIMALPKLETKLGWELQFFTNHVGHFILVTGLLDVLTEGGRVVMTSSEAHRNAPKVGVDFDNLRGEGRYQQWEAYGRSKISNILFAKELARRLPGKQTANAVHPGVIKTNLTRYMNPVAGFVMAAAGPIALKSIPEGAATQTLVAVSPKAEGITGAYWSHCNVAQPRKIAEDVELQKQLWARTEEIVASV
jgi:WW domain-containing oxidoreductase